MNPSSNMLSQFISVTKTDPGLAQDLLEGQNWNWDKAMQDFKQLQDIGATPKTAPIASKTPVSHSKSSPCPDGDKHLLGKPVVNSNGSRSPGAPRKLVRGISKANTKIVGLTRQEAVEDQNDPATGYHLVETPMYTFVLPDLEMYTTEFRAFIEKDLLEMTTMVSLENATCLNWWANACPKLWPMATTGDGNCLLHAASLGMWGFHDRQLTLRKALYQALTENTNSPRMQRLKRRWRWQQSLVNKESGLVYSEEEWHEEWKSLLKLASAEPRLPNKNSPPSTGASHLDTLAEEPESPTALSPAYDDDEDPLYESLEEFHVFVLANILQRPILVVSDTVLRDADGEAFAPIPFGGIYLPLDCPVQQCQKTPLVLTYDAAHFSALVPMERVKNKEDFIQQQAVIPVTDHDHKLLPLHFSVDPGPNWQWNKDENDNSANPMGNKLSLSLAQKLVILKRYLNLVIVPIPGMQREISVESTKSENGLHRQISSSSSESERLDSKSGKDRKDKKKSSFGKKLKFFSGLDKGNKGKVDLRGATSADNISMDRAPHVTIANLEDESLVIGAKMTERRHQLHDEMISNYLQRAKVRFEEEQKLLRLLENESSRHNHHPPRSPQHHQPPRISHVSNPSSQVGNPSRDLPQESHQNPRREGIPNRYPDRNELAIQQPSRGHAAPSRVNPVSHPVRHHQQQQPQVPESIVYVNRQANPKHQSNAMPNSHMQQNRNRGYPPPSQFPSGMRPASQEYPQPVSPRGRTSPDGRMSVPDGRLMPVPNSGYPGNRSPKSPRGRPVSQPPMSSQPRSNYDMSHVQKALPKSEVKNAVRSNGGKSAGVAGTKPCRTPDCDFYGTQATDYLCSKCYHANSSKPVQEKKHKKKGAAFWKK